MTGRGVRLLAAALGAGLLSVALVGCSASSSTPSTTAPASATTAVSLDVVVSGGVVSPPPGDLAVPLGSTVHLRVTSDTADDVHLHGYDLERAVPAGGTVSFDFTADRTGTFEVETHDSELLLTRLVVS